MCNSHTTNTDSTSTTTTTTNTTNARTYTVRVENREDVESSLVSLQRKAVKLGVPNFSWKWGEERLIQQGTWNPAGHVSDLQIEAHKDYVGISLTITGVENIGVKGWQVVAALEHTAKGMPIIYNTSGSIPQQYQAAEPHCDHCGIDRRRIWTYILQNTTTGEYKQVGSTCLKDFTGHAVDGIASYGELLKDVFGAITGGESLGNGRRAWTSLLVFLSDIASLISQYGWTPKSAEHSASPSTITIYERHVNAKVRIDVSEDDTKVAEATIEWARNLSEDMRRQSDYMHNLHVISTHMFVEPRHEGIAASMIAAYKRAKEQEAKRAQSPTSKHVGTVGKREKFSLTLERKFSFEGQYGYCYKLIFVDSLGNKVVWFTASGSDMKEGQTYNLLGTVKAHTVYKGTAQTEVTRCKIQ
jgi:hypothetical protein